MTRFTTYLIRKNNISIGAYVFLVLVAAAVLSSAPLVPRASADVAGTFSGYAWSDTIGWISLNCSNDNSCGTSNYYLSVASDGVVSGYMWSDSVGWISANGSDLVGCPSGTCEARLTDGVFSGWFKVLSGGSDGWDGFIRVKQNVQYGVTESNGVFAGYAWGDVNVGWIDFSPAVGICTPVYSCSGAGNQTITYENAQCQTSTIATCESPAFCSSGVSSCLYPSISFDGFTSGGTYYDGHITARPQILSKGATAKVYWNVSNATSCTVTGTNGDHWTGASSGTSGTTTSAITQQTIFTLDCQAILGAIPASVTETATVNIIPVFLEN